MRHTRTNTAIGCRERLTITTRGRYPPSSWRPSTLTQTPVVQLPVPLCGRIAMLIKPPALMARACPKAPVLWLRRPRRTGSCFPMPTRDGVVRRIAVAVADVEQIDAAAGVGGRPRVGAALEAEIDPASALRRAQHLGDRRPNRVGRARDGVGLGVRRGFFGARHRTAKRGEHRCRRRRDHQRLPPRRMPLRCVFAHAVSVKPR